MIKLVKSKKSDLIRDILLWVLIGLVVLYVLFKIYASYNEGIVSTGKWFIGEWLT